MSKKLCSILTAILCAIFFILPAAASETDDWFPESSEEYLTESDLTGYSASDLQMAVNEIYARHGRKFLSEETQSYFDSKDWYTGTVNPDVFYVSIFNEVEISNINLLTARIASLNTGTAESEETGLTDPAIVFEKLYSSGDYILPESGYTYLTEEDIADLSLSEIQLAVNEIYARHGKLFLTDETQSYFDTKDWYNGTIPSDEFDPVMLNMYEASNLRLLITRREALS